MPAPRWMMGRPCPEQHAVSPCGSLSVAASGLPSEHARQNVCEPKMTISFSSFTGSPGSPSMAVHPTSANLLAFEAVARRRSFALAAAELHLTASAVSHQVARLEAQLGVRLFERSAHGVRLSRAGQAYLERVSGALSAIVSATEDLRHSVGNSLYVHSAPSIASLWLMPAAGLCQAPGTSAELFGAPLAHGLRRWAGRQTSATAITAVGPSWEGGAACSRSAIAAAGPARPSVRSMACVASSNVDRPWRATRALLAVRFDRAQMSLDAATQGLGVALESAMNAGGHISDGQSWSPLRQDKAVRSQGALCRLSAGNFRKAAVGRLFWPLMAQAAAEPSSSLATSAGTSLPPTPPPASHVPSDAPGPMTILPYRVIQGKADMECGSTNEQRAAAASPVASGSPFHHGAPLLVKGRSTVNGMEDSGKESWCRPRAPSPKWAGHAGQTGSASWASPLWRRRTRRPGRWSEKGGSAIASPDG
ncbi:hypothetical protein FQR65_LT20605 [Abscondita terminalis]|nr:hypothetical protein FQR65_LT20605 [Abscondita terminalis]